jgi:ribosomal protein S12 methylthiotransferase
MDFYKTTEKSYFISYLGCSKNQVDAEIIETLLHKDGWSPVKDPQRSDAIIINTCGFIEDAKDESIRAIIEACEFKRENPDIKIVVTGCLGQRYSQEIAKEIPEIDNIIGINQIKDIASILNGSIKKKISVEKPTSRFNDDIMQRPKYRNKSYAYIRISEGCSNHCSYCAIPLIRGEFRSRSQNKIIEEAKHFIDSGVRELILISQDTTRYGSDFHNKENLCHLLEDLCKIDSDFWIRLLYCHPAHFSDDIIQTIKEHDKILKYIDIPLQHCNDRILESMGRDYTKKNIISLIDNLRDKLDNVIIRTTMIVGYPKETERIFEELLEFTEKMKFDRLGAFIYSEEEDTSAAKLKGKVGKKTKEERLSRLMTLQAEISDEKNMALVGKTLKSLIEKSAESDEHEYIGRSYAHAPDVDGVINIKNAKKIISVNCFYDIKITNSDVYDLYGEIQ